MRPWRGAAEADQPLFFWRVTENDIECSTRVKG